MAKEENTIAAVDRAADILDYLYEKGAECSVSAISADLQLYKSTVHRMLQTLKARGYVYQNPVTSHYGLGLRLFLLGSRVQQNTATVELVKPVAQELVAKYNECVHITVPYSLSPPTEAPKQLLIGKIMNPNNVLTVAPPVGAVTFCHSSASGKCMMAFSPHGAQARQNRPALTALTSCTITDWGKLEEQMEAIRRNGYAEEDGETEMGLSCTAVPVMVRGGLMLVLSVSGPTARLRSLPAQELVADLKKAADELSALFS